MYETHHSMVQEATALCDLHSNVNKIMGNGLFANSQLDYAYTHIHTRIDCVRFNISYILRMPNYSLYKSIL